MCALRLDPCAGPGEVRIETLTVKNATDIVLYAWPQKYGSGHRQLDATAVQRGRPTAAEASSLVAAN